MGAPSLPTKRRDAIFFAFSSSFPCLTYTYRKPVSTLCASPGAASSCRCRPNRFLPVCCSFQAQLLLPSMSTAGRQVWGS